MFVNVLLSIMENLYPQCVWSFWQPKKVCGFRELDQLSNIIGCKNQGKILVCVIKRIKSYSIQIKIMTDVNP